MNSNRGTRLINVDNWKSMVAEDVSGQDKSLQKSHKKNVSKHPKHRGGTICPRHLRSQNGVGRRADLTEDLLNVQIKDMNEEHSALNKNHKVKRNCSL